MMNLVLPLSTENVFKFSAYVTLMLCEDGYSRDCLLEMVAIVLRSRFSYFLCKGFREYICVIRCSEA